jgi:ABC-type phosphate/phosphonate transport system substrate-binding protein
LEGICLRTQAISLAAVALAVALIVAGCGDDSSVATSSISKDQFIEKVDAICTQGNKRMEAAFATFLQENQNVKRPSKADYEELVEKVVIPNLGREIREIRTIGAPSEDADKVGAILEALEDGLETAEGDPTVAVTSSQAVYGISSRLAQEYGLKVCSTR